MLADNNTEQSQLTKNTKKQFTPLHEIKKKSLIKRCIYRKVYVINAYCKERIKAQQIHCFI